MLESFENYINDQKLINIDEQVLVAVSGGIDSMVMLHLFQKANYTNIAVAHCNFNLRGDDSNKDEELITQYCKENNIVFHVKSFDTTAYAKKHGISIQMAARDLRYDWFQEICKTHDYSKIALAQHLDDQAETFLINLIRGTGIAGIHGILPINGNLIRPLLFTNRKHILAYQKKHDLIYREDKSNASDKYIRNYIRHNVLPTFDSIAPNFAYKLDENIANFREVEEFYKIAVKTNLDKISNLYNGIITVDIKELTSLHSIKLHIRELISDKGFNEDTINKVYQQVFLKSTGKLFESSTHELLLNRDQLIIRKKTNSNDNEYLINKVSDILEPLTLKFETIANQDISLKAPSSIGFFDLDKLDFPLKLRKWKTADSFIPFGMHGRKKLSDYFIDNKFSNFEKEETWVLISNDDIIWIVGHRTDNRYRVTKKTTNIYKITIEDGNN